MSQRTGFERWMRVGTLGALLALGCDDAPGSASNGGSAAGEAGA